MREITIVKNNNNKYSFQMIDDNEIKYQSGYIYDDVFSLENKLTDFLQEDLLLVKQGEKYGIFDGWKCELIIPVEYLEIEIVQHHNIFIFISTKENNNKTIMDQYGNKMFLDDFDNVMYIGFYNINNKYLYMYQKDNKIGVISTNGEYLIQGDAKYEYEYFRQTEYVILKKIIEQGDEKITLYDIYSPFGNTVYENVDNYDFLNV